MSGRDIHKTEAASGSADASMPIPAVNTTPKCNTISLGIIDTGESNKVIEKTSIISDMAAVVAESTIGICSEAMKSTISISMDMIDIRKDGGTALTSNEPLLNNAVDGTHKMITNTSNVSSILITTLATDKSCAIVHTTATKECACMASVSICNEESKTSTDNIQESTSTGEVSTISAGVTTLESCSNTLDETSFVYDRNRISSSIGSNPNSLQPCLGKAISEMKNTSECLPLITTIQPQKSVPNCTKSEHDVLPEGSIVVNDSLKLELKDVVVNPIPSMVPIKKQMSHTMEKSKTPVAGKFPSGDILHKKARSNGKGPTSNKATGSSKPIDRSNKTVQKSTKPTEQVTKPAAKMTRVGSTANKPSGKPAKPAEKDTKYTVKAPGKTVTHGKTEVKSSKPVSRTGKSISKSVLASSTQNIAKSEALKPETCVPLKTELVMEVESISSVSPAPGGAFLSLQHNTSDMLTKTEMSISIDGAPVMVASTVPGIKEIFEISETRIAIKVCYGKYCN